MRRQTSCIAITLAASLLSAPAAAAIHVFASPLSPEVAGATGSGQVRLTFDTDLHQLAIAADWTGLSGQTTVAHIHCCVAAPGNVGVAVTPNTLPLFPVGTSAGTYARLLDLTLASTYTGGFLAGSGGTAAGAEARLLNGLFAGQAYFNIHTNAFPGGEIRGFLAPVPEPASWALLIAGFAAAGHAMRRQRATAWRVPALSG